MRMVCHYIRNFIQKLSLKLYRLSNHNRCFTLLSRDCIGGVIYSQLGLKFQSPTINLFFSPEDFIHFCLNVKDFINGELIQVKSDKTYPVGELRPCKKTSYNHPVILHFMHYKSFDEAKTKWINRCKRIVWDKIYVVLTFCYPVLTSHYNPQLCSQWNKIPYKKVVIVDKHYGFDNEFVIAKPRRSQEPIYLLESINKHFSWKRVFNKYNFVRFLNKY